VKTLPCHDYDIYEEPGEPADNHHIFKWGVVVGVRKDIQVAQRVEITQKSLKGESLRLILFYQHWMVVARLTESSVLTLRGTQVVLVMFVISGMMLLNYVCRRPLHG
jgi:hypothetical protein